MIHHRKKYFMNLHLYIKYYSQLKMPMYTGHFKSIFRYLILEIIYLYTFYYQVSPEV